MGIQVETGQVLETRIRVYITNQEIHGNEELGSLQYRSLRVHVAPDCLLSVIKTLPGPMGDAVDAAGLHHGLPRPPG